MNAVDLLLDQHRHIEALFEEYGSADDVDARRRIVGDLVAGLRVHHRIEERVFYPGVLDVLPDLQDEIDEDLEEHRALERQLDQVASSDVTDERYGALLEVTQEIVAHHFGEEEDDLFPTVRQQLDTALLDRLGNQMDVLSRRLRKTRDELVDEARAAGVEGYSDLNKQQLAEAITAVD